MLCGAADYTICYYDRRLTNTHAHQLAASMVYASPLVTLFWYDRPQQYEGEQEISWFEQLPVTWDESRVLAGDPESYILIARRKGNTWYVAALNNSSARDIIVDLTALPLTDKRLALTLYTDDDKIPTKTHVRVATKTIRRINKTNARIPLHLMPNGGATMIIQQQ